MAREAAQLEGNCHILDPFSVVIIHSRGTVGTKYESPCRTVWSSRHAVIIYLNILFLFQINCHLGNPPMDYKTYLDGPAHS